MNLPPEQYAMPLESLNLPARIFNCLSRDGLTTLGEVLEKGEEELLKIRNFGEKSLSELYAVLMEHGVDVAAVLAESEQMAAEPVEAAVDELEAGPAVQEEVVEPVEAPEEDEESE